MRFGQSIGDAFSLKALIPRSQIAFFVFYGHAPHYAALYLSVCHLHIKRRIDREQDHLYNPGFHRQFRDPWIVRGQSDMTDDTLGEPFVEANEEEVSLWGAEEVFMNYNTRLVIYEDDVLYITNSEVDYTQKVIKTIISELEI